VTRLLLDSHTLLWALYDPSLLPDGLIGLLEDPSVDLYVREATLWELADKAAKNRLPLAGNSVAQFVHDIEAFGAVLLPIERADILLSVALPPHHGDPFDRLLVAQAQTGSLVLVSKDREIAKYDVAVLWN
jgi:PIN domain nuclease of toxin-antitoxin system